ncbi:MAG: methyltransferase domain-containing protein [Planctomycetes bacterium]|nr:methyltransferase domain-containing protein [Planctomycetota bacterium]
MRPRHRREWFDDDRFWIETYPFMFPEERFAGTRAEIAALLRLARPSGKAALDLCCGPGRCSIELARRGFRVTGVDRTRFLLAKARALARAGRASVEWVESDMRDFVRPEAYDLAVSLFTSFGYFDDKDEDRAVLRNLYASLKSRGVLVLELMGKERLARIFQGTTSRAHPDGSMVVERHEIFDGWTRIRNEWTLIRKGRTRTFRFHHTIYSGQEMRDRMEEAGFREIGVYGGLDGSAYDVNAARLVVVGKKGR